MFFGSTAEEDVWCRKIDRRCGEDDEKDLLGLGLNGTLLWGRVRIDGIQDVAIWLNEGL